LLCGGRKGVEQKKYGALDWQKRGKKERRKRDYLYHFFCNLDALAEKEAGKKGLEGTEKKKLQHNSTSLREISASTPMGVRTLQKGRREKKGDRQVSCHFVLVEEGKENRAAGREKEKRREREG